MKRVPHEHCAAFTRASGLPAPWAVVQYWPWWFDGFRGMALGPLILAKDPDDAALLCHELMHVVQFRTHPWTFWLHYMAETCRVGYHRNRYEIAARAVQLRASGAVPAPAALTEGRA